MGLTPIRLQRVMSIEKLFGLTDPPPVRSLYSYEGLKGKIDVQSESITMVLSRDVRANVRIGAQMVLTIARENPERDVWYINTYAGVALMKDAFREALENAAMPMPMPEPDTALEEEVEEAEEEESQEAVRARIIARHGYYAPFLETWRENKPHPSRPWEKWEYREPSGNQNGGWVFLNREESKQIEQDMLAEKAAAKAEHAAARAARYAAIEAAKPKPALPNLHLFDVPLGQWDAEKLAGTINAPHPLTPSPCWERGNPVLIINSFEYAPLNRNGKWRMAREILELQQAMSLTVVVFSHEMRVDLEAGLPGRGSLGLLSGQAGTVARLADPFEHLIRSRKPRNQPERGTVHEAQMLAPGEEESEKDAEEDLSEVSQMAVIASRAKHDEAISATQSLGLRGGDCFVGLRPPRNDDFDKLTL